MIHAAVPGDAELVPPGHEPVQPGRRPRRAARYAEFMGGLGDALLRAFHTDSYAQFEGLGPDQEGAVALMCHNPYTADLFRWHPYAERLFVYDLGFTTPFHPWGNREWRLAHGLPAASPCPGPASTAPLRFYPGPEDEQVLAELARLGDYVVFAGLAGTEDRDIPYPLREDLVDVATRGGRAVVVLGRSRYFRKDRLCDVRPRRNVVDLIDRLSVPGTALAVQRARGVICTHSAVCVLAWGLERPTCLFYPKHVRDRLLPLGPLGYMFGVGRTSTTHMAFNDYDRVKVQRWLADHVHRAGTVATL